ncbi:surface carbohydrate biosynthesis protein [Elongatibacter sediminis]|uniref:Surface carbohydrate biosynthesis protein n=1 Tax=Elongatibacter sediminis TaxID=3119006 RepID=A0AAW9R9I3_9GAMM
MRDDKPALIIPVESQVREMDAKLLLACCAAERGYRVFIGSRAYVHFAMADLPVGVYLAKSMRGMSSLMFRIIRGLGHDIAAWEEEALVHPPADIFYSLRLSPETVRQVSHLFAWGEENREVMQAYPHFPPGLDVHVTGNPRGDMLRPELRAFFDDEVRALRQEFGDFVMINTNFTDVNPFLPTIGLFVPSSEPGKPEKMGQAGKGMPREFATGLRDHKQAILDDFLAMIPALEAALPDTRIVLRPHPSEDHAVYHELAARCARVHVTHRGNVLPWLLACRALVHNGCTTAVESYAMGVPAVAYLATCNPAYDYDFQGLPNRLSEECFDLEALTTTVRAIVAEGRPAATSAGRDARIDHFIAAREGPLASERILDQLDAAYPSRSALPAVSPISRARSALLARTKALLTRLNMNRPGRNRRAYHDHRFPRLEVADVEARVRRLGATLGRFDGVRVGRHSEHIFTLDNALEAKR